MPPSPWPTLLSMAAVDGTPDATATDPSSSTAASLQDAKYTLFLELQTYVVCIFAVFIWDIIVTLPLEVRHIWPAKFSAVKLCFFIARYCTLLLMLFKVLCAFTETFTRHCSRIFRLQDYIPIFIFMCCNFKLAQRCASLFYSPRPIFYFLCSVIIAQAIVQCFCSAKNIAVTPPEGLTGCFSSTGPGNQDYGFVYWVLPLITHTIILLVTVIKVIQYWRLHGRTHLLDMFLRDGIQYFAVVTSANIVNVVYMKSKVKIHGQEIPGGNFHAALALCVTAMMVSRLILHMRVALADHTTVAYMTEVDLKRPHFKAPNFIPFLRNLRFDITDAPQPRYGATGTHIVFDVTPVVLQMSVTRKETSTSTHEDDATDMKDMINDAHRDEQEPKAISQDLSPGYVGREIGHAGDAGARLSIQRSASYHSTHRTRSDAGQAGLGTSPGSATSALRDAGGRRGSVPGMHSDAGADGFPHVGPASGLAVYVQTERIVRNDT